MADLGRTVRVSGLPTDIEKDRLTDKLCIHFLRTSNGGGEIESVNIVKATPGSALITFEESRVAQSVLQYGRHIFKVDGKKYELHLREHRKDLDPNKVILNMSVIVDYSQLPQGKMAVMHMHTSHPDVQISYNPPEELCTLRGLYSEVQAAVAKLLGHAGPQGTRDSSSAASDGAGEGRVSPHAGRTSRSRGTTEHRGREGQSERTDQAPALSPGPPGFSPHEDLGSEGGDDWELVGQTERGAGGLHPEDHTRVDEDFSLIMDADMFVYLQRHCGEEYQHILSVYGVEVVDVTAEGLTTVFLSCGDGVFEAGSEAERLSGARGDLSQLYQENEARLRKAQLPKSVLSPRGGLQRAMDGLQVRLPKLLLSEDDNNVYIVGSSSDVSEAKQFLLLDQGEHEEVAQNVASLVRSPAAISESPKLGREERVNPPFSSTGVMDRKMDKMLKSLESERKAEGARGYKLAARFKDLGVGGLGTRAGGTVTTGSLSPSTRPGLGPMLGHERLSGSEKTGLGGGGLSRAATQNIGEDILVRNGNPLFSPFTTERKNLLSSWSVGPGQGAEEGSPFTTTQNNFLDVTTFPLPGSGSSLRRTSSFSGRSRPKAQDTVQSKTAEDTGRSTTRALARSSSFSNHSGRDRSSAYAAEMTVSTVMWRYIKEVFALRLQGITLELQMEDNQSEGSRDITVTLSGGGPSAVRACVAELQKLVATVAADFCVQELRLAELGVAHSADATLKECCAEIRSQFQKVSLQIMTESVFLIGPKQLCSQVGAALREVFSGVEGQADLSAPSTSRVNQPIPLQVDGAPNPSLSQNNSPNLRDDPHSGGGGVAGDSQERKNVQRRDSRKGHKNTEPEPTVGVVSQPSTRRDPVMKDKLERGGPTEMDGCKTDTLTSHSPQGMGKGDSPVNGRGLPSGHTYQSTHTSQHIPTPPKDINLQSGGSQTENRLSRTGNHEGSGVPLTRHGPQRSSLSRAQGGICVCGETGASLRKTGCGLTLCPQCLLKVHIHCRVCSKAEQVPRGIQGRVSVSEMSLSLPGHGRDATVKITYCIPDGIQGEGHPSPGSAFQGGVFEAYLPLCERMHNLLPRLERAFRLGHTFTVVNSQAGAKVAWDCIPHKTSLQGGKSGNGYPDSNYLTRLSEALTAVGIEQVPGKSQSTNKI